MEREERHVEQPEQLERDVGFLFGQLKLIAAVVPGPKERFAAEGIAARPAERMPVADGEAQLVLEPLAGNDPVLVVPAKRLRRRRVRAAEGDRLGCLEKWRMDTHERSSFKAG